MDILNLVPLLGGEIDLRGIGLSATLIGTLGIIDDVALTQIAAVAELRRANRKGPTQTRSSCASLTTVPPL